MRDAGNTAAFANRYIALRHGQSLANAQGIIVSDTCRGGAAYGLTTTGMQQVRASIHACCLLDHRVRILSSPLLRARESAEIARELLGAEAVSVDPRLRERDFGDLDGGSDTRYEEIWRQDAADATRAPHGVEPAQQVRDRVLELLLELERQPCQGGVLLVAHGDAIQILWTVFAGLGAGEHRRFGALRPGQLLELNASLP